MRQTFICFKCFWGISIIIHTQYWKFEMWKYWTFNVVIPCWIWMYVIQILPWVYAGEVENLIWGYTMPFDSHYMYLNEIYSNPTMDVNVQYFHISNCTLSLCRLKLKAEKANTYLPIFLQMIKFSEFWSLFCMENMQLI